MPDATERPQSPPSLPIPLGEIEHAWRRAVLRYTAERRAKAAGFARDTYAWRETLKLHGKALGHDLWRAPANLALGVPYLATRLGAGLARKLGLNDTAAWLERQRLFFATDLGRELEWRVMTQFLELPYAQPQPEGLRVSHRDALAEALLAEAQVTPLLQGLHRTLVERGRDPDFRAWMTQTLAAYTGSRVAAADLTNALLAATAGGLAFHQLTPGALTLGPLLSQAIAAKIAAGSFPLGAGLGGLFFGAFETAAAPLVLTATVTGGLLGLAALLATFSGLLTDPLQQRLGLHRRRLVRMVDALERELLEGEARAFAVRDHYLARLLDLVDLLRALQPK